MKKIDFIIAGYPKCATSTIGMILKNHSKCLENKIGYTVTNEMHFYPNKIHFNTGEVVDYDWYHSHWDWHENDVLRFEKTPAYAFQLDGIAMLQEYRKTYNKDLKIILTLRNPILAYESRFAMYERRKINISKDEWHEYGKLLLSHMEKNKLIEDYKIFIESIPESTNPLLKKHIYTYCYVLSIKEILKDFPKENILVLTQESLKTHRHESEETIFSFLGITTENITVKNSNEKPSEQSFSLPKEFMRILELFYRQYNEKLLKDFGIDYITSANKN